MPPYIRRPHDEVLRVVLDPAKPASRLVVLRGDSCTGRSRAVYEAIADRLPDWLVCYPVTTAELGAGVPARTVLWLGELRSPPASSSAPAWTTCRTSRPC